MILAAARRRRRPGAKVEIEGLIGKGRLIGWREWVGLPDLGVASLEAKVDSGARTSSLHATDIRPYEEAGEAWVRFVVTTGRPRSGQHRECQARVRDRRAVKHSGGEATPRYVIATQIAIGTELFLAEVTLADRTEMGYPMLLGRSAMKIGRLLVHPYRSFLQGQPRR